MSNITTLSFETTTFNIIDQHGQSWLRSGQIAEALGYSDQSSINRIYSRRADEFTSTMTGTVKLTDPNGDLQDTRIFSLRGAHLLAMFARTEKAKAFRVWILDLIERESTQTIPLPNLYKQQPGDKLASNQQQQLRGMLDEFVKMLPKEKQGNFVMQGWSKLKAHFGVPYREIPAERSRRGTQPADTSCGGARQPTAHSHASPVNDKPSLADGV